ncbi:SigE family RNA polymerase sigma factor [Kitasatospora cathayae]|uniref:SigE family RNA polymerase sigma factor n=1 Tax=Kitasatospora cathayae TaxID=3004092 RepID=A0ABY7QGX2_9ACTN|nr:SigE family RNA polymerase sigma factor [Kitasatospora sp. HUAS 3-15]WBP92056.1 SigE family RNA polymerase sigma factor [Kitasatospora sp. HUAS 3-15]
MSPELEQSFDEFVAGRYAALRRTGYLLCGDWHLAEDLVQITLVKLYARWPRLREPESAAGYARTTLVRNYIDTRRLRRSHEVAAPELPDSPASGPAGASADPERRLALLAALAQVTPAYRAALVLRFWEDQTIEATAAVLRQSTGTVKSNTSRGLAQLRAILGDSLHEIAAD